MALRIRLVLSVIGALLIGVAGPVRAEIVRDLYSAEVPVVDQSPQSLAGASRDALADVLVKVSGSQEVLSNPQIARSLGDARQRVQQYAYRRGAEPDELYVRVEFDDSYVTGLVTGAGEPLWTANRPPVLLWLVVEDPEGRRFVSPDNTPELAEEVATEFSRRGVPIKFPLYDLADSAAIDTEETWRLHGPSLRAASERYSVQNVLGGRLVALSTGSWVGDWAYLYGRDRSDRQFSTVSSSAFAREGASLVAENMAGRYAVAASQEPGTGIMLSVVGVQRYAEYAEIVAWLEKLELVDHANVEEIRDQEILLRLHAQAEADQLTSLIELNRHLRPVPGVLTPGQLNYQWQN
mgnify:FL=1